ncbi:hypothetical protein VHUM_02196 [Vanrija humicola]|uniref:Major facilitator superfamily (MFS) profile domain-containing protein n=1 Tax=Vanrija humicola TaxID=5417 RepID=A0A7D8UZF6_VANHU|nr:hypothetical protein VHUM_02196 [Vanrija humicola]
MSRTPYQAAAVSSWNAAAQTSSLGVIRAVIAASSQPIFAKLSDFAGRPFVICVATVFYAIGCIMQATADSFPNYTGGFVFYTLAFAGQQIIFFVLIADTTSTRSRLMFSFVPSLHLTINAWVGGTIAQKVLANLSWSWGFGLPAITVPVLTVPLLCVLWAGARRAYAQGRLQGVPRIRTVLRSRSGWRDLFWQADVIGLLLLAAALALTLLPLTFGGGNKARWQQPRQIVPLVVGVVVCLPAFILWQWRGARHPIVPFRLLKQRHVLCGLAIGCLCAVASASQGSYLYFTLLVSFGRSVESATRIQNIYSFTQTTFGLLVGFVVHRVRRLKPFVCAGGLVFVLAYGLLYRYRGGHSDHEVAGIIGAEVLLGMAGGMVYFPAQAAIQAVVKHEHVAIVTALYTACFQVGAALGNSMSGAIWTNTMPNALRNGLEQANIANATALAKDVYGNPVAWIKRYPVGTPERHAVEGAYRDVQRSICIAGMCVTALLAVLAWGLSNPLLGDGQSLDDAQLGEIGTLEKPTAVKGQADRKAEVEDKAPTFVEDQKTVRS